MKYSIAVLALCIFFVSFGCTRDDDSLPIIITVETDKAVYAESDTAFFEISIINYGPQIIKIVARNSPGYDVLIYQNNEEIWNWRKIAYTMIETYTIAPGDTVKFGEEKDIFWTQLDNDYIFVPRGTYSAIAILDTEQKEHSNLTVLELR